MEKSTKKWWHYWIRPERSIPLATAVAAFVALLFAQLGIVAVSIAEQILLSLLGLLAIDALVERMGILERIEHGFKVLDALLDTAVEPELRVMREPDLFRKEPFEKYIEGGNEIFVSGGSLIGLFREQRETIERWLAQTASAKLKLILVDPKAVR